jgi:hypothetical protein
LCVCERESARESERAIYILYIYIHIYIYIYIYRERERERREREREREASSERQVGGTHISIRTHIVLCTLYHISRLFFLLEYIPERGVGLAPGRRPIGLNEALAVNPP